MPAGVYLHIPFCKSRCSYCDFATDVYRDSDAVQRYVDVVCKEIRSFALLNQKSEIQNPKSVDTIYFGGGTPSLVSPVQLEKILGTVRTVFNVDSDAEITVEMNPATVTRETLAGYRSAGVNRASFGVQTFNDDALKLLARGHDADDARTTFRMLRDAGYDNISFDLIAGLPGQTLQDWKRNLEEALTMRPEHLSLYLLEVHEGTPLAEQIRSGRRPLPDEDLAAEMYDMMVDVLSSDGYEQYEISNFAKPGYESRHNRKYWQLDPVYGFGVSAHSFDGAERYSNERDTAKYVELVDRYVSGEVSRHRVNAASEYVFLGLRLRDGIDLTEYGDRFGIDLMERHAYDLERLTADGLVEAVGSRLRLTRRGMLFSNEVFSVFV